MTDTDSLTERVARMNAPCGDGSSMGLRFIIALGLIEQSKMDPVQDELSREDALRVSYDVIRAAILETLRTVTQEPENEIGEYQAQIKAFIAELDPMQEAGDAD